MEFWSWSFCKYCLSVFSTCILILIIRAKCFKKEQMKKLPPGPWQLPIIGSLHHLLFSSSSTASGSTSLPHHIFRNLSNAYGSADGLLHLKLGEISMVVASSAEAAREIMKTHDAIFATRPLFTAIKIMTYGGNSISFAPYGHYWRQLRRICISELLSPKRVLSFRSIREDEVHNLIQSIYHDSSAAAAAAASVNLSEKLSSLTNAIMTRCAVGTKSSCTDQLEFIAAIKEAMAVCGGFSLADLFPSCSSFLSFVTGFKARLEKSHRNLDSIFDRIVQQHIHKRTSKQQRKHHEQEEIEVGVEEEEEEDDDDLVDVLLRLQESGSLQFELTGDRIKGIIQDMLGAGGDTSSVTLEWAMSELMRNPTVMARAQSEVRRGVVQQGRGGTKKTVKEEEIKGMNYLQLVIKETLRLHPPVPLLLPRECQEKCEVLGYEIPKGTRAVVNVWAMGRDPRYWEDAETFRPERFSTVEGINADFKGTSFEYLPFGSGRRMCPGITMGMANVELTLVNLLYHFDWELPPHSAPLDMAENFGVTAGRKSGLCLCPIPY